MCLSLLLLPTSICASHLPVSHLSVVPLQLPNFAARSQVCAASQDPHPKLLVMAAALMCSGAMGLPVSGFPNMTAVSLEDAKGLNYVQTADFLRVGVASSVFTYGVIVTLGYGIMLLVGW